VTLFLELARSALFFARFRIGKEFSLECIHHSDFVSGLQVFLKYADAKSSARATMDAHEEIRQEKDGCRVRRWRLRRID
jgi:hypothetical protein